LSETESKSDPAEKSSDDDESSSKKKKTKKEKKSEDDEASEESEKPAKGGCKYISEKDLGDILGHPIKFRANSDDPKTCNWDNPEGDGKGFIGSITVHDYNEAAWNMLNKKAEQIDDVGEKAAWGMGLMVKKGDKTLQVVMMKLSSKKNESRDKAIEVAKKVLPKV
jgi:hypothetical protein